MSSRRLVGPDDVPGHPPVAGNAAALHWILRAGVAACFAAQGASGMVFHGAGIPSVAPGGNPDPWVWPLVSVTGAMALAIAVLTLVRPVPALLLGAAVWGFQIRLFSGERVWESLEGAGAFALPLALLWSGGWPRSPEQWFWRRVSIADPRERTRARALQHRLRLQSMLGIGPANTLARAPADPDHAGLDLPRKPITSRCPRDGRRPSRPRHRSRQERK